MRRDACLDQPAEELAGAIGRVGQKPFGLQALRLLGTLDHGFGRGHFVVGTGRSGLHIDDDRVFDVDQIIEPVPELNALVSFGGPGRARVYRRDRFWQLAIRVGIFVIKSAEKLGNRTRLTFRQRPVDLGRVPWHDNDWRPLP